MNEKGSIGEGRTEWKRLKQDEMARKGVYTWLHLKHRGTVYGFEEKQNTGNPFLKQIFSHVSDQHWVAERTCVTCICMCDCTCVMGICACARARVFVFANEQCKLACVSQGIVCTSVCV